MGWDKGQRGQPPAGWGPRTRDWHQRTGNSSDMGPDGSTSSSPHLQKLSGQKLHDPRGSVRKNSEGLGEADNLSPHAQDEPRDHVWRPRALGSFHTHDGQARVLVPGSRGQNPNSQDGLWLFDVADALTCTFVSSLVECEQL